jgi:hypothetical protein
LIGFVPRMATPPVGIIRSEITPPSFNSTNLFQSHEERPDLPWGFPASAEI